MRVNGWGRSPRGPSYLIQCFHCTATLEFDDSDITTVIMGRVEFSSVRCPRCKHCNSMAAAVPAEAACVTFDTASLREERP